MNGENVRVDCVDSHSLMRCIVLVPDPWVVSRLYGREKCVAYVPDTVRSRKQMAFFEIAGYKYTSFDEKR